jgi:signal transduction histidine kinase
VFGILLLGPAVGFCLLGWRSLEREHSARLREDDALARSVLDQRLTEVREEVERVRRREELRPYFEYQDSFVPLAGDGSALVFQPSPLLAPAPEPFVLGWFQWELYENQALYGGPEVFPRENLPLGEGLRDGYLDALRARLLGASDGGAAREGRVEMHAHWNVSANEERGKLLEEIELGQRLIQQGGRAEGDAVDNAYLRGWQGRASAEGIPVRTTSFSYLAGAAGDAPPLLAWRLVWIPREQSTRREVKRDRVLLQGYALDPGLLLPGAWSAVGRTLLARGDVEGPGSDEGLVEGSLARELGAEAAGRGRRAAILPAAPSPRLVLRARPDRDAARVALEDARRRFLFLVAGLVVVVALGFLVLVRSVRKDLEVARRKEDFVAAITHELKTPLAGIRMYAEMLKEGWVASPEAAEGYATRILDETDRLGHLVDQVLDLAALERGVARLNAAPGDLSEAVRSAVALLEPRAREAGVALDVDAPEGLPAVVFDPRLVRPLVLNLVDNAIKYSARSPTKEVLVAVVREGERTVLRVADRGVGMTAATRRRLFEPFRRAGDELTREAPGVGIGLALVRRYAEAHGARVFVESARGKGTTVEVRFPAG